MRRIILIGLPVLIVVLILLGVTGGLILSARGSLHPGSSLFGYQYTAEQWLARLNISPEQRAERYLELAQRRLEDLRFVAGTDGELEALVYLNTALDQLGQYSARHPDPSDAGWLAKLDTFAADLQVAADGLIVLPERFPLLNQAFKDKVTTFKMLVAAARQGEGDLARLALIPLPFPSQAAQTVSFTTRFSPSDPSQHKLFPLVGKHALQDCQTCHSGESYTSIPVECKSCHQVTTPAGHYEGSCVSCHSPILWNQVHFDHELVKATDCMGCHLDRRPENHFQEQCSFCHSVNTFKGAKPNHELAKATDCIACHRQRQPEKHYDVQCSLCHVPSAWEEREKFDHAAAFKKGFNDCTSCHSKTPPQDHIDVSEVQCDTCHNTKGWKPLEQMVHNAVKAADCLSCHTKTRPENHFTAQCSTCHNTQAWKPVVKMDHSLLTAPVDCLKCHSASRPANHINTQDAQCSDCHNTAAWKPLERMNHALLGLAADCQNCHLSRRPANHFAGQCSTCHNTNAWRPASFNHQGVTTCASCHESRRPNNHFTGDCSSCHRAGEPWTNGRFNHQGVTTCASCHEGQRPNNHFTGDCSSCHRAGEPWSNGRFDHQGVTTCASCHEGQRPNNHFTGDCSSCHRVGEPWSNGRFTHEGATNCETCHSGVRPNPHFGDPCASCHDPSGWGNISTPSGHSFPVNHNGADANCSTCHSSLTEDWTCTACHSMAWADEKHHEVPNYTHDCMACHPTGQKPDRPEGFLSDQIAKLFELARRLALATADLR